MIYETDTNQVLVYDGSYWISVMPQRNLLFNGAMQVAQRATSASGLGTVTAYYTADRWQTNMTTMGTWTQSVENDAPTGSGFRKSLKMLCTTANASLSAGSEGHIRQMIEGQNLQSIKKGTSSAEQITISFWVKSNRTGTYTLELYDNDNTRQISKSYSVSASDTWEFKSLTFPADTTGAFDNDNGLSLYVLWWLAAGTNFTSGSLGSSWASATSANRAVGQTNLASATNNYWQITGVQMDVGANASPFEFKDYGRELAECQRYYEKSYNTASFAGAATAAGRIRLFNYAASTQDASTALYWKVRKRAAPTTTVYDWSSGASGAASIDNMGETGGTMFKTLGTLVAEFFQVTADAEL